MGIEDYEVEVSPYDPRAPWVFERVAEQLAVMLPENAVIEHVGSTAIPGVGGKGILDCLVMVNPDQAAQVAITLWEAGYDEDIQLRHMRADWWYAAGDFDLDDGAVYPIHIHITWTDSTFARDLIDFRNYMRANPDEAAEYERLKRVWAEQSAGERATFTAMKTPYVEAILARARREE